jgi:hypothetical protein
MSAWRSLGAAGFQPAYASLPVAGEPQDLPAESDVTLMGLSLSSVLSGSCRGCRSPLHWRAAPTKCLLRGVGIGLEWVVR